MELNVTTLKNLNIVFYNMPFDTFKKYFSTAIGQGYDNEDYFLEKFKIMRDEGVGFLNRLDDATAELFLNEILVNEILVNERI